MYPDKGSKNLFLLPVDTLCSHPPASCTLATPIREVAGKMSALQVSSLLVVDQDRPCGIVTLEDLCDLIAQDAVSRLQTAKDIMSSVATVQKSDYAFEALYRMTRYNTHRLAVIDESGSPFGILTDSDLLRLHSKTPLYISSEIEAARSLEELREINLRMPEAVDFAMRTGADIRALTQLISHLNDTFTRRVITLLEQEENLTLPPGAACLALGSEGRKEQTLRTDQDSAIVFNDNLPASELAQIARFSDRLVEALETIGVPRCPGDTMVSNPAWRKSLSAWKTEIEKWISLPQPEHMVEFGMFQDFRTLHGDTSLEHSLREHLHGCIKRYTLFLPYMARHIVGFKPPLRLFGRFRTERTGPHRGTINLKKAGIFAITEGVSLLALEAGLSGGSTWEKMGILRDKCILTEASHKTLQNSFSGLGQLRLQRQLMDLADGKPTGNHVDPMLLSLQEQDRLREALRGVNYLLRMIRDRYRLDLISR